MLLKPLSADLALLYLANIAVPGRFEPTQFGGLVVSAPDAVDRPIGPDPAERWALQFAAGFFQLFGRGDGAGCFVPYAGLPAGARLLRFGGDGEEPELMGTYRNRRAGWRAQHGATVPGPVSWRLRPSADDGRRC